MRDGAALWIVGIRLSKWSRESPRKRLGERAACALPGCGACRRNNDRLQAADRVKVIACPDHSYGGRARLAVIAAQVVTHGFDEAAVGDLVMGERFAQLTLVDQGACEIVVPVRHAFGGGQDLAAGRRPVASGFAVVA